MTWVAKDGGLGVSGWLSSAYAGGGILGANVSATGTGGASPVYNDLSLPADAGKEYYWRIVTPPATGTLTTYEDTSFAWIPAGVDDSFTYQLYENYVAVGSPTLVTLDVITSALSGNADLGGISAAGGFIVSAPGISVLSGNAILGDIIAKGRLGELSTVLRVKVDGAYVIGDVSAKVDGAYVPAIGLFVRVDGAYVDSI